MKVPTLKEGADLRTLNLSASDGFVLSQIDGKTALGDISDATGIPVEQVRKLVDRLVQLGLMEWRETEPTKPSSRKPAHPRRAVTRPPPPDAARVLYDPAELDEDVEINMETKRMILDAFYRVSTQDHYEVLEVPRNSEKKDIRTAYFRLSKVFHTDRFFGKNLGSYQSKMEAVFKRLTEAYETLSRKKTRASYDDYLTLTDLTQAAQEATETRRHRTLITKQRKRKSRPPVITEEIFNPFHPQQPSKRADPEMRDSRAPIDEPAATTPVEPRPLRSEAERRKRARALLDRRLGRRGRRGSSKSIPKPEEPKLGRDERLKGLARSLKESAALTGGVDRVDRHIAEARAARASGDLVRATNSLRLALSMDEERPGLQAEYDEVKSILATSLADTYAKQAEYEEKQKKWAQAALSWIKVIEGRPTDVLSHERAVVALLKANGDLRAAQKFAVEATRLAPQSVTARTLLGQVYVALGMTLNARRELQAAAKLDPADNRVKNLLSELK